MLSLTQIPLALSSEEAEYGAVKTASGFIGFGAIFVDLGLERFGKVRHLETGSLWLQRALETETVTEFRKVDGKSNVADFGTKPVGPCNVGEAQQGISPRARHREE